MTIHRDDNNDIMDEEETNDDTTVLALDKKDNDESLQEEIDINNSKNKNETNEIDCTCPICLLDFGTLTEDDKILLFFIMFMSCRFTILLSLSLTHTHIHTYINNVILFFHPMGYSKCI